MWELFDRAPSLVLESVAMQSPSSETSIPDQPGHKVGEILNAGIRVSAWSSVVGGSLVWVGGLVAIVSLGLLDSKAPGPSDGIAISFALNILVGALVSGLGVWRLHRFPRIQIHETGLRIRDQLVPFAAITEVVKKERTFACVRYVEHGVTNEASIGVSWMFGGDLAPVIQWLASRAAAAQAETATPLPDASRAG